MVRSGTICTSRSTSVVLPVPDGAETTKRIPDVCLPASGLWPPVSLRSPPVPGLRPPASFDILDLLAHLLELRLHRDDERRRVLPFGLRPDGVDLAVHLLDEEVELAAAWFGGVGQRLPV